MRNFRGGQMKLFALRRLDVSPDPLSFRLPRVRKRIWSKYASIYMSLKYKTSLSHCLYVSIKSYKVIPFWKPSQLLTYSRFSCPLFILNGTTTKHIKLGAYTFELGPIGTVSIFHFNELIQPACLSM